MSGSRYRSWSRGGHQKKKRKEVNVMLEPGTKAPDFALRDQNGQIRKLTEYRGRKVVLYFNPKDNTAGCSKQACGFAELYPHFQEKDAVVIGVSKDSVASHKRFEEKYSLPFTLLSDPELEDIKAYDERCKDLSLYDTGLQTE